MPDRLIRERCRTSRTLHRLSAEAERLFWRLTTLADDYGRFEAEPTIIRSLCFPLWETLKTATVHRWIEELTQGQDPAIQLYEVSGKRYGFFPTWSAHQRIRAKHSKHPAPSSDNICCQMLSRDNGRQHMSPYSNANANANANAVCGSDSFAQGFAQFWHSYPKKVGRTAAERAFRRLGPRPPLEAMLSALAVQRASRQWQDPQFIPNPKNWLTDRRWEDEPERGGGPVGAGEVAPAGAPLSDAQRERLRQLTESVGK